MLRFIEKRWQSAREAAHGRSGGDGSTRHYRRYRTSFSASQNERESDADETGRLMLGSGFVSVLGSPMASRVSNALHSDSKDIRKLRRMTASRVIEFVFFFWLSTLPSTLRFSMACAYLRPPANPIRGIEHVLDRHPAHSGEQRVRRIEPSSGCRRPHRGGPCGMKEPAAFINRPCRSAR